MKLHELKQKRNTIATDMRALHDKIGDTTWTEEQRTQWNAAKSELDALDERIARGVINSPILHCSLTLLSGGVKVRESLRVCSK